MSSISRHRFPASGWARVPLASCSSPGTCGSVLPTWDPRCSPESQHLCQGGDIHLSWLGHRVYECTKERWSTSGHHLLIASAGGTGFDLLPRCSSHRYMGRDTHASGHLQLSQLCRYYVHLSTLASEFIDLGHLVGWPGKQLLDGETAWYSIRFVFCPLTPNYSWTTSWTQWYECAMDDSCVAYITLIERPSFEVVILPTRMAVENIS